MTSVNVTAVSNTLVVTENGSSTVVTVPQTSTVTAITQGPQGPQGPKGDPGDDGLVVNSVAKVDGSVVYYDGGAGQFKADSTWTVLTLIDGGNF
jgi:hypothetical protein